MACERAFIFLSRRRLTHRDRSTCYAFAIL